MLFNVQSSSSHEISNFIRNKHTFRAMSYNVYISLNVFEVRLTTPYFCGSHFAFPNQLLNFTTHFYRRIFHPTWEQMPVGGMPVQILFMDPSHSSGSVLHTINNTNSQVILEKLPNCMQERGNISSVGRAAPNSNIKLRGMNPILSLRFVFKQIYCVLRKIHLNFYKQSTLSIFRFRSM